MATISPKLDLIRSVDALKNNPLTRKPVGQGQHIYAYCNIRTNQVIYSLTQILRPHRNLRQLPDAGNNTKPPKLRKDLWRPLWTLTLPAGFQGEAQGLQAWTRLNALRYMHELYWTPSKELSRHYSEEEMEKLQDRLLERGGSKKNTVYDLIKREKKKLRLKNVMDQKANSVADLAAVLVEQEGMSDVASGEFEPDEIAEMVKLKRRADVGGLEDMEEKISSLNAQVKDLVKKTPLSTEGLDTKIVRALRRRRYLTRKELKDTQKAKEEMEHALLTINLAKPEQVALTKLLEGLKDVQAEQIAISEEEEMARKLIDEIRAGVTELSKLQSDLDESQQKYQASSGTPDTKSEEEQSLKEAIVTAQSNLGRARSELAQLRVYSDSSRNDAERNIENRKQKSEQEKQRQEESRQKAETASAESKLEAPQEAETEFGESTLEARQKAETESGESKWEARQARKMDENSSSIENVSQKIEDHERLAAEIPAVIQQESEATGHTKRELQSRLDTLKKAESRLPELRKQLAQLEAVEIEVNPEAIEPRTAKAKLAGQSQRCTSKVAKLSALVAEYEERLVGLPSVLEKVKAEVEAGTTDRKEKYIVGHSLAKARNLLPEVRQELEQENARLLKMNEELARLEAQFIEQTNTEAKRKRIAIAKLRGQSQSWLLRIAKLSARVKDYQEDIVQLPPVLDKAKAEVKAGTADDKKQSIVGRKLAKARDLLPRVMEELDQANARLLELKEKLAQLDPAEAQKSAPALEEVREPDDPLERLREPDDPLELLREQLSKAEAEMKEGGSGRQDVSMSARLEYGIALQRRDLEVPLLQQVWDNSSIVYLMGMLQDGEPGSPQLESAKTAREVLLGQGGDDATEAFYRQRLQTLEDMLQAAESRLQKPELPDAETMSAEERASLQTDVEVWKHMISAYLLTGCTLAVKHPETSELYHLGSTAPPTPGSRDQDVPTPVYIIPTVRKPSFSMDGVKVTWQNILDAEFAPAWPGSVQHEWMGITRHAAPKPGVQPSMTAQEYYEGRKRPRVEKVEEKVRGDVVKSVAGSIIRQLIGARSAQGKSSRVEVVSSKDGRESVVEAS